MEQVVLKRRKRTAFLYLCKFVRNEMQVPETGGFQGLRQSSSVLQHDGDGSRATLVEFLPLGPGRNHHRPQG